MTDKTPCVCVCVCVCVCARARPHMCGCVCMQLTFGLTAYQGLLATPRWPLIHPQHNDSSEEKKEANHYIKTDCLRLRIRLYVCVLCTCVCVRARMSGYVFSIKQKIRQEQGTQEKSKIDAETHN